MKQFIFAFILSFVSFVSNGQTFTIPVFPDTQRAVNAQLEMFVSQMDWIVNQKDSLNIPIVLHVGDLVDYNNFRHWDIVSKEFEKLDQNYIPYAITLGNHDTNAVGENTGKAAPGNVNQNLRNTDKFNSYFPNYRFATQRGRYEEDKSDNAYYTFYVKDTYWLVLTLEFCPRLGAINWAEEIVQAHPDYNVIVLTHYHLSKQGEIVQSNAGYGDFSPQTVYDRLIKKYSNIRFVLSGHTMHTALRIDKGDNGNSIYQILSDYQNENRGGGYLRLLHFDLNKKSLVAEMYSPFYNCLKNDSSKYVINDLELITK